MSKNNSNFMAIAGVAIVALLLLSGYLYYSKSNLEAKTNELSRTLSNKEQAYDDLNNTYHEAVTELENMKGDNVELNALIEKQKDELKAKKNQISGLIRSKNDLAKARAEMDEMRLQLNQYITEINDLKQQNAELAMQNQELGNQNESLRQDLTSKIAQNEELQTVRAQLVSEKENLSAKAAALGKKVDIASVVRVNEVDVTGYKERKSGKLAKKKFAKNVDVLEVCFQTTNNLVAPAGAEVFFVRVIDPSGQTLAIDDMGSGVLKLADNGESLRYTTAGEIDYQNEAGQVCMNWKPNIAFAAGNYTVEVYNKGYLAGKDEFQLK